MKTLISLGTVLAFAFLSLVTSVSAGDLPTAGKAPTMFYAFSRMPPEEHASLIPLTDNQLASIEGTHFRVLIEQINTLIQMAGIGPGIIPHKNPVVVVHREAGVWSYIISLQQQNSALQENSAVVVIRQGVH